MMRLYVIWFYALLLVSMMGCEHWNLEPVDVVSELKVEGALNGMPFVWDASVGQMQMDANDEGATCTLPLATESGTWQLQFHLVLPASNQDTQSALESAVHEGDWPLHPASGMDGILMEMYNVPEGAVCNMNGTPWDYEQSDWVFDPSTENSLNVSSGSGACATWTEFTWLASPDCQTNWMTEAFSVQWDDELALWELTPPEEDSIWVWSVTPADPVVQQGVFYLPEIPGNYVVVMARASLDAEGMGIVTRFFPGHNGNGCEVPEVACGLEWEHHAYLKVQLVDPEGEVYTTSIDCTQPAGEFEALEVTDFTPNASGVTTRLVRFDCALELLDAGMEPVQLDVEAGQIAFPLHD